MKKIICAALVLTIIMMIAVPALASSEFITNATWDKNTLTSDNITLFYLKKESSQRWSNYVTITVTLLSGTVTITPVNDFTQAMGPPVTFSTVGYKTSLISPNTYNIIKLLVRNSPGGESAGRWTCALS